MTKIKFGTDGWRAVISEDFTFDNVKILAQAMADYVKGEKSKINNKKSELYKKTFALVVGYDTRFLSDKYAELVACVLAANGIKVILALRPTPTPSVSFYIRHRNLLGGIMITASHNPGRYNGIKYKNHFGSSVVKDVTDKMESRLFKTKVRFITKDEGVKKGLIKYEDIVPVHIRSVKEYARLDILKHSDYKVLVDSMNGTGANLIEEALKETNIKVKTVNGHRDAYFGGRPPEPNERVLATTGEMVKKGRFHLGLATDGDADRLGVILPDGKVISGHKVMTLLLLHLLEDRRESGAVVQTICGTGLINKICKAYGIKTYETSVGFKYISELVNKEDVLIGGEETGGVALKGWIPERDGIASGILILEMISARKKSLTDILREIDATYGTYVYKRDDLRFSPAKKKRLVQKLKKKPFEKILGKDVTDVKSFDGFKFIRTDGSWLMLRASGTEPKLRVYSEAHSEREAVELIQFGKKFALSV